MPAFVNSADCMTSRRHSLISALICCFVWFLLFHWKGNTTACFSTGDNGAAQLHAGAAADDAAAGDCGGGSAKRGSRLVCHAVAAGVLVDEPGSPGAFALCDELMSIPSLVSWDARSRAGRQCCFAKLSALLTGACTSRTRCKSTIIPRGLNARLPQGGKVLFRSRCHREATLDWTGLTGANCRITWSRRCSWAALCFSPFASRDPCA